MPSPGPGSRDTWSSPQEVRSSHRAGPTQTISASLDLQLRGSADTRPRSPIHACDVPRDRLIWRITASQAQLRAEKAVALVDDMLEQPIVMVGRVERRKADEQILSERRHMCV